MFASIPDLRAEITRVAREGETVWSEWDWVGTRTDGERHHMRGVIVMGVREERIAWARLYMEPVEEGGAGIEATMRRLTGSAAMKATDE
jgi:ketosteroid isomerase-like protein